MSESLKLSFEELVELTGYDRPSGHSKVLRALRVVFTHDKAGKVIVLRGDLMQGRPVHERRRGGA